MESVYCSSALHIKFYSTHLTIVIPHSISRVVEELKAHKFLLALASPYFHQIFFATGGDNSGQVVALDVENTSKEALEETINFMYNHPLRLHHASLATLFLPETKYSGLPENFEQTEQW